MSEDKTVHGLKVQLVSMESRKRIQLVLDAEAQKVLEKLQAATGANSMAEVLRDALGVYDSLHEMLAEDEQNTLAIVDRKRSRMQELHVPSLARKTTTQVEKS